MVQFFSTFRIQSRMILGNSVPNPKSVAPQLQKLYNRKVSISSYSECFGGFGVFLGGWGSPNFTKFLDPRQNDISKHCTKFQTSSSKFTKVTYSRPSLQGISRDWRNLCLIGGLPYCHFDIIIQKK